MDGLEARKSELEAFLADASEPPPLLHPEMANFYRAQITDLHSALQDQPEANRLKAGEVLRSLVKEIILTPEEDQLAIDVRGDLAGILAVSVKTGKSKPSPARNGGAGIRANLTPVSDSRCRNGIRSLSASRQRRRCSYERRYEHLVARSAGGSRRLSITHKSLTLFRNRAEKS